MICWKGQCVLKSTLNVPSCDQNKCSSKSSACVVDPYVTTNAFKFFFLDNLPIVTTTTLITTSTPIITTIGYYDNTQWKEYNGHWYFFNSFELVQSDAEDYCNYFESTLAQVTDADQLNFLINNVLEYNDYAWVNFFQFFIFKIVNILIPLGKRSLKS